MKITEYTTHSPAETKQIAEDLVKTFHGGEVILASGSLGAGKTAFCQGIGKALGVKGIINSPTFNLIKVYQGKEKTLYHVDCYRLENADEQRKDIGLDDVMGDESIITYIEWPVFASESVLNYHPIIKVEIDYIDEEKRKITIQDERF